VGAVDWYSLPSGEDTVKLGRGANRVLRIGFVAVALLLLAWGLQSRWDGVRAALVDMGPLSVAGSLATALVGLFCSALCWRALLADLGSPLTTRPAVRVFFLSQIGKYLPGSVWPFLAQMELGRDLGVPRRRSAVAGMVFVALHTLTGLVVAAGMLPLVSPEAVRRYAWALLAVPVGLVALHPRVLNPAINRVLRLARRPTLDTPLHGRGLLRASAWLLVMWMWYGLSVLLLATPLGVQHGQQVFFVATGAYALSWAAGFLVVVAPAGLGIREAVIVLTLSRVLPVADATAVAAVSRVVQTAGDGLWALVAALLRPSRTGDDVGASVATAVGQDTAAGGDARDGSA
jgi:glycosyltransferase 2 family protein